MKSNLIIKCPLCGREYLPAEIYLPDSFLGKPKNIVRNDAGKITEYFGHNMDLRETYICDTCGTDFKINCKVTFYTEERKNMNFDQDYISSLKKPSLFLSEK